MIFILIVATRRLASLKRNFFTLSGWLARRLFLYIFFRCSGFIVFYLDKL